MKSPARNAFQLLDWIISRHVHEYFDTAGRPLGEGRATAFQQIHTEMRLCPYADRRHHHAKPMNVSALQQMPAWPDILTVMSWLSHRYRVRRQTSVSTSDDLAQVTGAGVFLPDFLALRRRLPLHSGDIPVLISSLYKVCLGFQLAYLPERFDDSTELTQLPNTTGFLAYLEANELLIGEEEVCSGSPLMITQAYEAIIGQHRVAVDELPPPCRALRIDWDEFDQFADHGGALWLDVVRYAVEIQRFCPQLTGLPIPADQQDRLNAHLKKRHAQLLAAQKGLAVDMARAVLEFGNPGSVASEPVPTTRGPGRLASVILEWLRQVAGEDVQNCEQAVARALQLQLAPYETREREAVAGVNQQLNDLSHALGYDATPPKLSASALSRIFGPTLCDWAVDAALPC